MDMHEEIRFRVTNINFTRVTKTATGIQATTTEASDKAEASVAGDMRQSLARRRSSSVDLSDNDPTPSAIHILVRPLCYDCCLSDRFVYNACGLHSLTLTVFCVLCVNEQGTIDEDGLGLTSWWVN